MAWRVSSIAIPWGRLMPLGAFADCIARAFIGGHLRLELVLVSLASALQCMPSGLPYIISACKRSWNAILSYAFIPPAAHFEGLYSSGLLGDVTLISVTATTTAESEIRVQFRPQR